MSFDFETIADRIALNSSKWLAMSPVFGVPEDGGIAMSTADSDYPAPPCVSEVVRQEAAHGIFGYVPVYKGYLNSVVWWMENRHGWTIDPDWIVTTQALGNAISLCIQNFSKPGDGVVIFTPVYHEFCLKVERNERKTTQCPLVLRDGRYELDLDDAQARLTGNERILLWCSPHNPVGRVWSADELRAVSEFAARNDLILISDEIHHDLVYGGHEFIPMDCAVPEGRARTIYLTAPSKTFNLAGQRTGQMIIPDPKLRDRMKKVMRAMDFAPGSLAMKMTEAAYSPEGAAWADAQIAHLEGNRALFDKGMNAIPGVRSIVLEGTFLAWVDFSGTGMAFEEFSARIRDSALIAANPGPSFGKGGETFMRFNLATQRACVEEAVARLQSAFSDLQ